MVAAARKGSLAGASAAGRAGWAARIGALRPWASLRLAIAVEWEARRLFLWLPVSAGTGVLLYLAADREPVVWLPLFLAAFCFVAAVAVRARPLPLCVAMAGLALCLGFLSAEWRSARVATPMLDRIRIVRLTGRIEQVDQRPVGARFVLRIEDAGDLDPAHRPVLVRLTTRRADPLAAGDNVAVMARLLPPSRAALPGGYDFARDAYFSGIGAVGSALGLVTILPGPHRAGWVEGWRARIDRTRNDLAARVEVAAGGGDAGAVAAAMVTGKRDRVSAAGREIIREAGIFHIITIAGVQMTLVAALLFGGMRRLLALSPSLALRYPTKIWAALFAMAGALAYDLGTGARIGTQRALFMTLIMLGAVLCGRRALTMRNLALAALAIIAVEPEAIAGASFQLSFAAVAALIAVQEARHRHPVMDDPFAVPERRMSHQAAGWNGRLGHVMRTVAALFVATIFATCATASFMAAEFHELSPYVFIGNPLTLAVIEFFAVPGALIGTVLYPLGLDGWVWSWVGLGIRFIFWVARFLAAAPASTVHVTGFAPWALPCLAMALLSIVIWRTALLRATALPWLLVGLLGATSGPRYDLLVAPTGDAVAVRGTGGALGIVGKSNAFMAEQWLRADGDARATDGSASLAATNSRCDKLGCVVPVGGGQMLSVVAQPGAFEDDCRRAALIVTPLFAPASCAAEVIIDRGTLETTGAIGLVRRNGAWVSEPARTPGEDRPWSPAPKRWRPRAPVTRAAPSNDEPEPVRLR